MPGELERTARIFNGYYNHGRDHEGLGDVTSCDVYAGSYLEVINRRTEAKSRMLQTRRHYNAAGKEQGNGL